MGRFIYSVGDIFSLDHQNGCLGQHSCIGFLIESYQRGYKWDSEEKNLDSPAPVNTLFRDIVDAMQKDSNSQYYLQFINVKENEKNGVRYLEVIDGQQRLTTLSILAAVLKKSDENFDFAGKTIRYCCRDNNEKLLDHFHDDLNSYDPADENDDQTNWFFLKAYQAFGSFVDSLADQNIVLADFYSYLVNNVFIIVNVVRETVRSEDIFNNLNSRKVFLTNVELIKGLLLCKAVRNEQMPYRELLERRTLCGRQWDEMTRWLNNPDIGAFFFESTRRACYDFLLLTAAEVYEKDMGTEILKSLYSAAEEDFQPDVKRYNLFNLIYSKIRNAADANHFFNKLCDIYWCLHDIYDNIARHNEIGFILFPKKGSERISVLKKIIHNGNGSNIELLKDLFQDKLADATVEDFIEKYPYSYSDSPVSIRRDLMFINCFKLDREGNFTANEACTFPFHEVDHGEPDNHGKMNSLEHIFPQNPLITYEDIEKEPSEFFDKYTSLKCAELIEDISIPENDDLAREYEEAFQKGEELSAFYDKQIRNIEEVKKELYEFYAALTNSHKELFGQIYKNGYSYLDSIGNVVLLLGGENATVGNFNFAKKRTLIREMINNGRPVPAHTFDAFSKIGGDMNHMECWRLCDVKHNEKFTLSLIFKLRQALKKTTATVNDK